ncbi:MAG: N-acetylmuramoyl-L-alanine amidase [Oscillospiraceae bacterium]
MRRVLGLLLACFLLIAAALPAQAAGPNGEISIGLDEDGAGTYRPASVSVVRLTLNGAVLDSDVPAFVRGGRTMVPVRLITERMGATVQWFSDTNQVAISLNDSTVTLKIGSSQALVNGEEVTLYDGVPAMVAKYQGIERTMVPLRFVSEQLGAQVGWAQDSYTAVISTGQAGYRVTDINADSNAQSVHIVTTAAPDYRVLDLGDRVVVDLLGAELSSGFFGTIAVDNELISRVRYAEHGSDLYPEYSHTVRVVLDLKEGVTRRDNVELIPLPKGLLLTTFLENREEIDFTPTTPIDPQKKTVVLDAGHGGSQTGAVYSGVNEKDINLAVAQKVEAILLRHGYNVVMTRTADSTVGLYDRADIANAVKADVFVSIHSNAAVNSPNYTGIYTYYHPSSRRGARLAQAIQEPICWITGAVDRGIKDADFVVLRETDMCAVLVEMGFMTNSGELQRLITPSYQDKLAAGIAEGIVAYLNGI